MTNQPGIFCLEGEWGRSMRDELSVEPVLRLLGSTGHSRVIHRDVGTRDELKYYAQRWAQKQYADFRVGYLAFHGEPGRLWIGRHAVTLRELAETLDGRCRGRVIYMGSCSTLAAKDDELQEFCKTTGAKALVGYTRNVDWLEGAAFDVLLLWELAQSSSMKPVFTRLSKRYPDLTGRLGFRMATMNWVSDQAPAVAALEDSQAS